MAGHPLVWLTHTPRATSHGRACLVHLPAGGLLPVEAIALVHEHGWAVAQQAPWDAVVEARQVPLPGYQVVCTIRTLEGVAPPLPPVVEILGAVIRYARGTAYVCPPAAEESIRRVRCLDRIFRTCRNLDPHFAELALAHLNTLDTWRMVDRCAIDPDTGALGRPGSWMDQVLARLHAVHQIDGPVTEVSAEAFWALTSVIPHPSPESGPTIADPARGRDEG